MISGDVNIDTVEKAKNNAAGNKNGVWSLLNRLWRVSWPFLIDMYLQIIQATTEAKISISKRVKGIGDQQPDKSLHLII